MIEAGPPPPPPDNIRIYVEALGPDLAADFLAEFGGIPLYFARNPTQRSRAVAAIGEDGVRALGQLRGGESPRPPMAKRWVAQHYCWRGWTVTQIAQKLRTTDVTVRNYLRGVRDRDVDFRQLRLFDHQS